MLFIFLTIYSADRRRLPFFAPRAINQSANHQSIERGSGSVDPWMKEAHFVVVLRCVGLSAMIFDLLPCFLVANYCFSCMNRPLCSCVLWTKHCLTFLCGFSRSQCTFELSMFDWMRGARRVVKVFKVSEGLAFLQWINHIYFFHQTQNKVSVRLCC